MFILYRPTLFVFEKFSPTFFPDAMFLIRPSEIILSNTSASISLIEIKHSETFSFFLRDVIYKYCKRKKRKKEHDIMY